MANEVTAKYVRDCTCEEVNCDDCPFRYNIYETENGTVYDKQVFNLCVTHKKGALLGEVYEKHKNELKAWQRKQMEKKLKKLIVPQQREGVIFNE